MPAAERTDGHAADDQGRGRHAAHPDAPERQRAGHQHDLRAQQDGAPGVAVGERARHRSDDRRREERAEGADSDPHRRMGQLVEHVGHRDGLHPGAGVREQRGGEEEGEVAVAHRRQRATPVLAHRAKSIQCTTRTGVRLPWVSWCPGNARSSPAAILRSSPRRAGSGSTSVMTAGSTSCRGYLGGADTVLDDLVARVPWRTGRRPMYDRMVDDPRLVVPLLRRASRSRIPCSPTCGSISSTRYRVPLGALALNYYRDGRDSVAFHRDRELRELDDTVVAILTLGAKRPFRVRPFRARRHPVARPRPRIRRPAGDGRRLPARMGARRARRSRRAGPRVSAMWRWARRQPVGAASGGAVGRSSVRRVRWSSSPEAASASWARLGRRGLDHGWLGRRRVFRGACVGSTAPLRGRRRRGGARRDGGRRCGRRGRAATRSCDGREGVDAVALTPFTSILGSGARRARCRAPRSSRRPSPSTSERRRPRPRHRDLRHGLLSIGARRTVAPAPAATARATTMSATAAAAAAAQQRRPRRG